MNFLWAEILIYCTSYLAVVSRKKRFWNILLQNKNWKYVYHDNVLNSRLYLYILC